jgi:hypothetical protein
MFPHGTASSFLVCSDPKCGAQFDTTPPLGPSTIGMFAIYASKLPDVRAKFASMARKAARLGLIAPALVEVGAPFGLKSQRERRPSNERTNNYGRASGKERS